MEIATTCTKKNVHRYVKSRAWDIGQQASTVGNRAINIFMIRLRSVPNMYGDMKGVPYWFLIL
jgi:hypothetical protein